MREEGYIRFEECDILVRLVKNIVSLFSATRRIKRVIKPAYQARPLHASRYLQALRCCDGWVEQIGSVIFMRVFVVFPRILSSSEKAMAIVIISSFAIKKR